MKTFARVAAMAAVSLISVAAASATTIGSYGQNNTAPSNPGYVNPGFSNTVLTIVGGTTYDIGTGGAWANPTGGSSWVAQNPGDCPGCGNIENNGTYTFTSTLVGNYAGYGGSITVLADDTTSVFLNGSLVTAAAAPVAASKCTVGTPNCATTATYNLSGFINGTNTLTFGVQQLFGNAEGLDFSGTINPVPEPSSLLLLGTGLVGSAGMFFRRLRA